MIKLRCAIPVCIASVAAVFPAVAQEANYDIYTSEKLSAGVGLGILRGQTKGKRPAIPY